MKNLTELQDWLKTRNKREQLWLFGIAMALTYLVWQTFIGDLLSNRTEALVKQANTAAVELKAVKIQLQSLSDIVQHSSYAGSIKKRKQLSIQFDKVKQRLDALLPNFTDAKDIPRIINSFLNQKSNIKLSNFKRLPPKLWSPAGISQTELPDNMRNIKQEGFEVKVTGTYFNILEYLTSLEKLSWHVYWENLNYKVTDYPIAEVTVTLYILIRT